MKLSVNVVLLLQRNQECEYSCFSDLDRLLVVFGLRWIWNVLKYLPTVFILRKLTAYFIQRTKLFLRYFRGEKNLTDFTIPDSVQYIPSGAFFDNPFLENIVMPDSVEAVGEAAFQIASP